MSSPSTCRRVSVRRTTEPPATRAQRALGKCQEAVTPQLTPSVPSEQTNIPAWLCGHPLCRWASLLKCPEQFVLQNDLEGGGGSHTVGHCGRSPSCHARLGRRLSSCGHPAPTRSPRPIRVRDCCVGRWDGGVRPRPPGCWLGDCVLAPFHQSPPTRSSWAGGGKQRQGKGRSFLPAPSDRKARGAAGGALHLWSLCVSHPDSRGPAGAPHQPLSRAPWAQL